MPSQRTGVFHHKLDKRPDFKQWFINTLLATVKRETSFLKKEEVV